MATEEMRVAQVAARRAWLEREEVERVENLKRVAKAKMEKVEQRHAHRQAIGWRGRLREDAKRGLWGLGGLAASLVAGVILLLGLIAVLYLSFHGIGNDAAG